MLYKSYNYHNYEYITITTTHLVNSSLSQSLSCVTIETLTLKLYKPQAKVRKLFNNNLQFQTMNILIINSKYILIPRMMCLSYKVNTRITEKDKDIQKDSIMMIQKAIMIVILTILVILVLKGQKVYQCHS